MPANGHESAADSPHYAEYQEATTAYLIDEVRLHSATNKYADAALDELERRLVAAPSPSTAQKG